MSKKSIILISIFALILLAVLVIAENIKNNISGDFIDFKIKNIKGLLNPKADIELTFKIVNNSWFSFVVKDFKVDVYNNKTGEFLTENVVKKEIKIPKGESSHEVLLRDNSIIGNANDFVNGLNSYLALISFNIMGIDIYFEELITL